MFYLGAVYTLTCFDNIFQKFNSTAPLSGNSAKCGFHLWSRKWLNIPMAFMSPLYQLECLACPDVTIAHREHS